MACQNTPVTPKTHAGSSWSSFVPFLSVALTASPVYFGHDDCVSRFRRGTLANLFHMKNACLPVDPLLAAGVDQNRPPSRSPCWLLLLGPGWRQQLSDKHPMVWWKGFLWFGAVVGFMAQ